MRLFSDIASAGGLKGKKILIRADLNIPMQDGKILDETRIKASLPTIELAIKRGEKTIIMSHLGRPDNSKPSFSQPQFSLSKVAERLSEMLSVTVRHTSLSQAADSINNSSCLLLENTRFWEGESANNSQLSKTLANLCDIFVMDAFGSAHRAHSSTLGVAHYAPIVCGGLLLEKEIDALNKTLNNPMRPLLAIIGGAKVGEKLKLLDKLANLADNLIVGGGIANTFLAAKGVPVGNSLYESSLQEMARSIMIKTKVLLPCDLIVAKNIDEKHGKEVEANEVKQQDMILDIGQESQKKYDELICGVKTIIWNGPVGVFEKEPFSDGTKSLVKSISKSLAYSLAGGGETLAAISRFADKNGIDYISTGGGAFLEYIEQGSLPAIKVLNYS